MKIALRPSLRSITYSALALSFVLAFAVCFRALRNSEGVRTLPRSELELREGVLYAVGEERPFQGKLVEFYPDRARKLSIEIKDGRLNGHSLGWYPDGQQLEVDEQFVQGVSHGPRTRWHANGNRKSLAQIQHGQVVGLFIEWHENGKKAVEMTLRDGHPDGVVEAWHPSGAAKSRLVYEGGKQVAKEFWPDPDAPLVVSSSGETKSLSPAISAGP